MSDRSPVLDDPYQLRRIIYALAINRPIIYSHRRAVEQIKKECDGHDRLTRVYRGSDN